jgi:hypothetical protein
LKWTLVGSALAISIVVVSASIASDQPRVLQTIQLDLCRPNDAAPTSAESQCCDGDYAVDAAGEPVVDSTSVLGIVPSRHLIRIAGEGGLPHRHLVLRIVSMHRDDAVFWSKSVKTDGEGKFNISPIDLARMKPEIPPGIYDLVAVSEDACGTILVRILK